MERLSAVILCGGTSRRMGRPKEWLPIGEEVLLQRVVRQVARRVSLIVVSARGGQALPPLPSEVEVISDPVPDRGPLQGIAVGMAALAGRAEWTFACGTDTPLLQPAWIDCLLESASDAYDLILPEVEGREHPLAALYRPNAAAPAAARLLESGQSRLRMLSKVLRTRTVTGESFIEVDPELLTLQNINHPDEYEQLLTRIAQSGRGVSGEP